MDHRTDQSGTVMIVEDSPLLCVTELCDNPIATPETFNSESSSSSSTLHPSLEQVMDLTDQDTSTANEGQGGEVLGQSDQLDDSEPEKESMRDDERESADRPPSCPSDQLAYDHNSSTHGPCFEEDDVDKITPELFKVRLKECKQKVLLQEGNPEESDVEEENQGSEGDSTNSELCEEPRSKEDADSLLNEDVSNSPVQENSGQELTDEALNVEDNSRQSETEEDCSLGDSSDDAQDAPTLDSSSHSTMVSPQCPLGLQAFLTLEKPMGLQHLTEIEKHVAANCPDCPHPPLNDIFFDDDSIKGTTLLLMACYYGELASVKRIVESWGVDVNLAATFYPHQLSGYSKIKKASPLFVAASSCYLDIVRYLVGRGAIVSAKTSDEANSFVDGLTPLYGAFLKNRNRRPREQSRAERLEELAAIARVLLESGADPSADVFHPKDGRAMWESDLCGIAAITALIDHGLAVNHRTPDGLTLMTYWIRPACTEEESVAVVQLLLDNSADVNGPDFRGMTPISRAAYFKKWALLDFLLERSDISRKEKIDALELAGAIILENLDGESAPLFPKACEYWRRSLHLRLGDLDGSGLITKIVPLYQKTGRVVE